MRIHKQDPDPTKEDHAKLNFNFSFSFSVFALYYIDDIKKT